MENISTIFKNFGRVPCGQKIVDVVKFENKTKNILCLSVKNNTNRSKDVEKNLHIHPVQTVVQPKQTAKFTLSYTATVEDATENFSYDIVNNEEVVAHLKVHAESVGPCLHPEVINLRFFRLRDVNQTGKNVEIANKGDCDAKYYFDIDEDSKEIEISQRSGTIKAGHKLILKLTFNPVETTVFYKRIYCLVQYHKPIVFNILGVNQPKLKVEPKNLCFYYPPEMYSITGYEGYIAKGKLEKMGEEEKILYFQKLFDEEKSACRDPELECPEDLPSLSPSKQHWSDIVSTEIFLTKTYIDVKSSFELNNATTLVNISECRVFYYNWNDDPCNSFHIEPCQGFIEPKSKVHFNVYLTPSTRDSVSHAEIDLKILPYTETKTTVIHLPLTITLRVIGNSFLDSKCHWLAQCKVTPKILHLTSCVPNENLYGTFMIERQGHLPFTFEVVPPKKPNLTVQPTLGYLSESFQLFVVQFSSESKEPGIYEEDVKIKLNDSELNAETVKICCSVENPTLRFGKSNSFTFPTAFPGSVLVEKVPIENPTNLHLRYEFKVPEDITWTQVINPTGSIGPKSTSTVEIIYQPETPSEYLDYIPCDVSSMSKPEFIETIYLQLIGSCQFGYLVATPSDFNLGVISYREKKTFKTFLYNFSSVAITFRLSSYGKLGDAARDVKITPDRGVMPPKGSLEVEVTVTSHEADFFTYEIYSQNFEDECKCAQPCEDRRSILTLRFEGVLPSFQIKDICFNNGGPLFSPDWAWKMFCVDKINAALKHVDPDDNIEVTLPEAPKNFGPLNIHILMECSGDITCESKVNVVCPCHLRENSRSSDISSLGSAQCAHKRAVVLKQVERKSDPPKQVIINLKISYAHQTNIKIELFLMLPHNRTITITAPLTVFSDSDHSAVSFYTTPNFHLKPVFVGDLHPPIQLFWLYNNSRTDVAYCLDVVSLQKSTNVEGIFDCVNPIGVVPSFSSAPLGLLFRPNEIISYSTNIVLHFLNDETKIIHVTGDAIVKVSPISQYAIQKTIPRKTLLELEELQLECYENTIDIPFLHVFSQAKRHFYIKNRSNSIKWAFRWHSFNIENIFSATVEPEEGVVEPSGNVFLTVILKSYAYPTFLSFSIPCDVTNYSELKDYMKCCRQREKIISKEQNEFLITEKAVTHENKKLPVCKRPGPNHIFLTVNTNIITGLNIDQNLIQKQQSVLKAQQEMQNDICHDIGKPGSFLTVQGLIENLIWHYLCKNTTGNKLKDTQKVHNYNYSNSLGESKTVTGSNIDQNLIQQQQSVLKAQQKIQNNICHDIGKPGTLLTVQGVLENLIWHILCSNTTENKLKNTQKVHNYNYSNLLRESKTKTEDSIKKIMALPDKNLIQEFLANQMTDVLCKNFLIDFKNE